MATAQSNKVEQLGMPFGTASNRLKKALFFKYIKLANQHFCFDCKKEILTVEDLSIQHKQVWLHIDPTLFWDLENIAFSHKKCNKTERRPLQKYFTEEQKHEAYKQMALKSWHKEGKWLREAKKQEKIKNNISM